MIVKNIIGQLVVCIITFFTVFSQSAYARNNVRHQAVILLTHMTPYTMMLDHRYQILVKIYNNDKLWPAHGKIRFSYHLLDLKGKMLIRDFTRTYMPIPVRKGQSIELKAKVFFPSGKVKPGKYLLQWDIVEEGVKWYSFQGLMKKEFVHINLLPKRKFYSQKIKQMLKFLWGIFIVTILPGSIIVTYLLSWQGFPFFTFITLSFLLGISYCNVIYLVANWVCIPVTNSIYLFITILFVTSGYIFFCCKNKFYITRKISQLFFTNQIISIIQNPQLILRNNLSFLIPVFIGASVIGPIAISHITFPNIYDLSTHASFVRKIFDTGLSLSSQVFSFEVPWSIPSKGYYPVGIHRVISMIAKCSGVSPLDTVFLFFAFIICLAPLTLMIFLKEYLASNLHLLLIGIAVSLYTIFPYQPLGWGGMPLTSGMVLTPLLLVIVKRFFENPCFKTCLALSLGMLAVFLVHPPELYTSGLISCFLFSNYLAQKRALDFKKFFIFGFLSIIIFLLILFPELRQILYVQFLRATGHLVRPPEHWSFKILLFHLFGAKIVTGVFVFIGILYLLLKKQLRIIILLATFFVVIAIVENYVNTPFGNLWQHRIPRIYYNTYFFIPVLWGSGLYGIYNLLSIGDNNVWTRLKTFVLFSVAACYLFYPLYKSISYQVSYYFDYESGMNANDYIAINWLSKHISKKDIILNQHGDSSLWIYPMTGLKIWGGRTYGLLPYPDFALRKAIQQKFARGDFFDVLKKLAQNNVKYIYISRTKVAGELGEPFRVDLIDQENSLFKKVYNNSDVVIYKISYRRKL